MSVTLANYEFSIIHTLVTVIHSMVQSMNYISRFSQSRSLSAVSGLAADSDANDVYRRFIVCQTDKMNFFLVALSNRSDKFHPNGTTSRKIIEIVLKVNFRSDWIHQE